MEISEGRSCCKNYGIIEMECLGEEQIFLILTLSLTLLCPMYIKSIFWYTNLSLKSKVWYYFSTKRTLHIWIVLKHFYDIKCSFFPQVKIHHLCRIRNSVYHSFLWRSYYLMQTRINNTEYWMFAIMPWISAELTSKFLSTNKLTMIQLNLCIKDKQ